jgi:hypothetical protein
VARWQECPPYEGLMDGGVPAARHDFIHLVFDVQLKLLEALLLKLVLARNMRLGFYLLYLVLQMRMLLGQFSKLLICGKQMRFEFFFLRVILHERYLLY